MIAQSVLLAWIVVGVMLFAVLPPTRAFILTYVIGILLLPVEVAPGTGSIFFTNSIRIDKYTSCHIGAIVGTLIFATERVRNYRFEFFDFAYLFTAAGVFITSLVNGLGAKDGLSNMTNMLRLTGPMILLAKMHISTMNELYICLRAIIGGAVVYTLVAIVEFRLSPQIHRTIYGYFQHGFDQFIRYQHFRPVGMLRHAIELSFFMGSSCLAALWLWWKRMLPPLWGFLPGWAVVGTLVVGLAVTLTFSGYTAMLFGVGLMVVLGWTQRRWVIAVLPAMALLWMVGRYAGVIDPAFLVDWVARVDATRAESLGYRIQSEDVHLEIARANPVWGRGAMEGLVHTRTGTLVRAVDAFWLIMITFFGGVGLIGWLLVWSGGIVTTWRIWGRAPPDVRWIAALVSVMLGLNLVDFLFNSFPSYFLLILTAGLVSVGQHLPVVREGRARGPAGMRPAEPAAAEGGVR